MNTQANHINEDQHAGMVGNPMLSQIREFIDADNEPQAAVDPLGILRRSLRGRESRIALAMLLVALLGANSLRFLGLCQGSVRGARDARDVSRDGDRALPGPILSG